MGEVDTINSSKNRLDKHWTVLFLFLLGVAMEAEAGMTIHSER